MDGWIKLHRKLLNSDMYLNLNSCQRDLLIQCLLMANHKTKKWEYGKLIFECFPGQFITSLEKLKSRCAKDVTIQNVRTALVKLEKWGFLTNHSTKTGRLITICNYSHYQDEEKTTNKDVNKALTKHQQSTNKELTTNKNDKNEKNEKNIKKTKAKKILEKPDDVNEQVWNDFVEHRKQVKAPLTETALKGIVREAKKANIATEDALIECTVRGWRGFKAEWINKNNRANTNETSQRPTQHKTAAERRREQRQKVKEWTRDLVKESGGDPFV